jgi:glycosyltransferase involved in cell wall biosynthesis
MKGSLALSSLIYLESSIHAALGLYKNNIDHLIAPSQFYIDKFKEWNWNGSPFSLVRNFADIDGLEPNFNPGKYFVYFGRLSAEKGLPTLVEAAAKSGIELWLVGTGPLEEQLRLQVNKTNANVKFCGFQKGEDLWRLIRESKAIVLPSEWYENAPLTIIEAYACGKPAIGAEIGGIPELIRKGETGATFVSGDSDDLARVLCEYKSMSDTEIIRQGQLARKWAEEDFTVQRHVESLIAVYRKVGVKV